VADISTFDPTGKSNHQREPDREAVAMNRTVIGDAIFAVVFSIVMVTIARFLWAMM
jgi:hypothetical protein